jgi:hypothetical protein
MKPVKGHPEKEWPFFSPGIGQNPGRSFHADAAKNSFYPKVMFGIVIHF